jgi:hypothetical protein
MANSVAPQVMHVPTGVAPVSESCPATSASLIEGLKHHWDIMYGYHTIWFTLRVSLKLLQLLVGLYMYVDVLR